MKVYIVVLAAAMLGLSACSQESKVKNAIQAQVKEEFLAKATKDFKGTEKSKVWSDLKELMISKTSIEVTEVKVDGNSATGTLKITSLEDNTTGGLVLLLAFASGELDKKKLGLKEAFDDLRKSDKRVPAMADYPLETKTYAFVAEKGDGWKLKDFKKENLKVKK